MPLNPKFIRTQPVAVGYVWNKHTHSNSSTPQILADELADRIMKSKFPSAAHIYNAWLQKKTSGQANTAQMAQVLETTIKLFIGLQTQPKPADHRQGWVAEHLWYFLMKGSYPNDNVALLFDVGISPTDPGGDGLVIHTNAKGELLFRLWEIKKVSLSTNPNSTITTASNQLAEKGGEYISRYVINSQEKDLPQNLREYIDHLAEKWIAQADDSAAGITIVSSMAKLTSPSFASLATAFPKYATNNVLEGRTIELQDFDNFCELVCRSLWNGI